MKFEDVLKNSRKFIKLVKKSRLDVNNKNVKYTPLSDSSSSNSKKNKDDNIHNENKNLKIFTIALVIGIVYICLFAQYKSRHHKNDHNTDDNLSATDALVKNEILADEIEQEILEEVETEIEQDLDYSQKYLERVQKMNFCKILQFSIIFLAYRKR